MSKRLRRVPASVRPGPDTPKPDTPKTFWRTALSSSDVASTGRAGTASCSANALESTRSATSFPQSAVGSGTTHDATFLHADEGTLQGAEPTHRSAGAPAGAVKVLSQLAPSTGTRVMQWRTVRTTFALISVPEQRTSGLDGPPVAIATACVVVESSRPPSTA